MNPAEEVQFDDHLNRLLQDAYASQQHALIWLVLEWFSNYRIDDAFLMMSNAIDATQNETVKRALAFFNLHREIIEAGHVSEAWLSGFRKRASKSAIDSTASLSEQLSHLAYLINQSKPTIEQKLTLDRTDSDLHRRQHVDDLGPEQENQSHSLLGMGKVKRDESKKSQSVSPSKEVSKPKQKSSWSFVLGVMIVSVVIAAVLGLLL